MTSIEKFMASAAIREKPFEISFNGAILTGIVRIHPAAEFNRIINDLTPDQLSKQIYNADLQRTNMFPDGKELDNSLPVAVQRMLADIFIEANTGKKKED